MCIQKQLQTSLLLVSQTATFFCIENVSYILKNGDHRLDKNYLATPKLIRPPLVSGSSLVRPLNQTQIKRNSLERRTEFY